MTRVLGQRRWRSIISLLAMVAWLLGTNFCALGLMAAPCPPADLAAAAASSACSHCPVKAPDKGSQEAPKPLCCHSVQANLPPATVILPPLAPWAWTAIVTAESAFVSPATTAESSRACPKTGPPLLGELSGTMRALLGRCAPVHAPPTLG